MVDEHLIGFDEDGSDSWGEDPISRTQPVGYLLTEASERAINLEVIMIKDHNGEAKEFKAESSETNNADINSFVDQSIPVVDEHLKRIIGMKR